MTQAVPLEVRLITAARDIHVTREIADLSFRTVIPGGYASATLTLQRPLSFTPPELAYYGRLRITDGRTARVVWEGRIEDLGRGSSSAGQVWTVNAVGPMAHAQDHTVPLIYQDVDLSNWKVGPGWPANWNALPFTLPSTGQPGLQINIPNGTAVPAASYRPFVHTVLADAGQHLAEVTFNYGEDATKLDLFWNVVDTTSGLGFQHNYNASDANIPAAIRVTTDFFPGGVDAEIRLYAQPFTVATDNLTVSLVNIKVRSTLYNQAGVEYVNGAFYAATPLSVSNVVEDLLGRGLLPLFDGANAIIDASNDYTFVEQCAYPNGTNAAAVLADLMTLLPDMFWASWESNTAGLARFEWSRWPTTVRYDATAGDGFSSPGSAVALYDKVTVRWVDSAGVTQTTTRTRDNGILDDAGRHRTAYLDLGSGIAGLTAATQAGDQYLAANAVPPNAGTLEVARPIYDRVGAKYVQPWEILPGTLIRVRDVAPVIGGSGRDGVTTFRVVAVTYQQSTNTAELELDSPSLSLSNQLAAVSSSVASILRN